MVRLEGFEPPTIRVEAEYSNPLSYNRIFLFIKMKVFVLSINLVRMVGLEPTDAKF